MDFKITCCWIARCEYPYCGTRDSHSSRVRMNSKGNYPNLSFKTISKGIQLDFLHDSGTWFVWDAAWGKIVSEMWNEDWKISGEEVHMR
mgnify:FL=1